MTPPLYSTVYLPGKGHVVEVEEGCSVGEHRVDIDLLDVGYVADRVPRHVQIPHVLIYL